jgi:hypothetical protein
MMATRAKAHAQPTAVAQYHAGHWPHFGPGLTGGHGRLGANSVVGLTFAEGEHS